MCFLLFISPKEIVMEQKKWALALLLDTSVHLLAGMSLHEQIMNELGLRELKLDNLNVK